MGLPTVSIQRPVMVAMLFAGLISLGLISLNRLPVELYQGQDAALSYSSKGGLRVDAIVRGTK
jgi:hypothetical protein